MKIKSFGCSFMFGNDLPDVDDQIKNPPPSNLTWPALIAKGLEVKYECHAVGGSGNLQILEKVLSQAAVEDNSFFIIGWTWIDRFDYFDSEKALWNTVLPGNSDKLSKNFYSNFHSEYHDKLLSLIYIQTALETLQRRNIPFLMTYLDDLILDNRWHSTLAVRHLQLNIQKHFTTFEGMNFLQWSRKNNYAESKLWHPLEDAHRAAADYMSNKINHQ
jgi:hypothetical protein